MPSKIAHKANFFLSQFLLVSSPRSSQRAPLLLACSAALDASTQLREAALSLEVLQPVLDLLGRERGEVGFLQPLPGVVARAVEPQQQRVLLFRPHVVCGHLGEGVRSAFRRSI